MGRPNRLESYQTLGDLTLGFEQEGTVEDYLRELDLDTATARVSYRIGGVRYVREVFVSAPDQVIVVRVSADTPGRVSFSAGLGRQQDAVSEVVAPERMELAGALAGGKGLAFHASLRILADGGRYEPFLERIAVEGANAATLLIAAATSFRGGDPKAECERRLDAAAARGYERLQADHVADHRRLFRRVALRLGLAGGRDGGVAAHRRAPRTREARRARPRSRGALLPVRPLPADRSLAGPATCPPTCRASGTSSMHAAVEQRLPHSTSTCR